MFGDPPPADPPPRISRRSPHYRFALYVAAGYSYEDACRCLGVSARTAERWRTALRKTATAYFGRPVTYEYAVRVALDPELRGLCEAVRASPH